MLTISFYVDKQNIQQRNSENLVNDSSNYVKLHFDFGTDWDNVTKRVLFKADSTQVYCKELDNNNEVVVPWEVLIADYFTISLYGVGDNNLRITTPQKRIHLAYSGYSDEIETPLPPTPSVIDDIYDSISETNSNVQSTNGRIDTTNQNVTTVSNDLNQTKTNLISVNTSLEDALSDIKDLQDSLSETDETVSGISTTVNGITEDITEINGKLENTIEMEVTFEDETTATYNVVVKPDESD